MKDVIFSKDDNKTNSGLSHWWHQKISAFLLLPITLWFIMILPKFLSLEYSDKISWIYGFPNYLLLSIFFIISGYHIKLGLTVVVEDYIHNSRIKKILVIVLSVITLLMILLAFLFIIINVIGFK